MNGFRMVDELVPPHVGCDVCRAAATDRSGRRVGEPGRRSVWQRP